MHHGHTSAGAQSQELRLQSQYLPAQVFNLHLVPVEKLAGDESVLLLDAPLCVLEGHDPLQNAMVCHQCVPKHTLNVINDFSLMVHLLIKVKKLFALQRLHDLRLLDCQRL